MMAAHLGVEGDSEAVRTGEIGRPFFWFLAPLFLLVLKANQKENHHFGVSCFESTLFCGFSKANLKENHFLVGWGGPPPFRVPSVSLQGSRSLACLFLRVFFFCVARGKPRGN